ncbi:MAG: hypothetical protein LBB50_04135, partial [Oscillospiraceae bacterium]|jgi:hypothetical protein|nr:hypothetical protein [Oscillospiraceae bacterium]
VLNTTLSLQALAGLAFEARKDYRNAFSVYNGLYNDGQNLASTGIEQAVFGADSAPAISIGTFVQERELRVLQEMNGPFPLTSYYADLLPEGKKVPRRLRQFAADYARVQAVYDALEGITGEEEDEVAAVVEALAQARQKNKNKTFALYCDALELQQLFLDPDNAKAVDALLKKLQNDPDAAFWMYGRVALRRAIQKEDYEAVAALSEASLAIFPEDYDSARNRVKALWLRGEKDEAQDLIEKYSKRPVGRYEMRLVQAELAYRGADYKKAAALCDEVIKAKDAEPETITSAVAAKAAANILAGNAKAALAETRALTEQETYAPNASYVSTMLAAAIVAGDTQYFDDFVQQELPMYQYYINYAIPQAIFDLQAGDITAKALFAEGWGGFDA